MPVSVTASVPGANACIVNNPIAEATDPYSLNRHMFGEHRCGFARAR